MYSCTYMNIVTKRKIRLNKVRVLAAWELVESGSQLTLALK